MMEFFFDPDRFVCRGCCGKWHDSMIWLYVMSNMMTFLGYMVIPWILTCFRFQWERVATNYKLRTCFAGFVLFCGIGHLEGPVAFALPLYHLFAVWHLMTALVTWLTIYKLFVEREREILDGDI